MGGGIAAPSSGPIGGGATGEGPATGGRPVTGGSGQIYGSPATIGGGAA